MKSQWSIPQRKTTNRAVKVFIVYLPMMSFGSKVIHFLQSLPTKLHLPAGIKLLHPFQRPEVMKSVKLFYQKFYSDSQPRIFVFGINPGRFGAGVTGIPFTDPIHLEKHCQIKNEFPKRHELSSLFVYQLIDELGGPEKFFNRFYLTAVCPLGFVRAGKNLNYYDDRQLIDCLTPFIVESIDRQQKWKAVRSFCICWGEGKNFMFLSRLNKEKNWFDKVIPLPHPRWVMQYRRKKAEWYITQFIRTIHSYGRQSIAEMIV